MFAKALADKSKIKEIPLSIFDECKRIDPPISKWVSNTELMVEEVIMYSFDISLLTQLKI